MDLSLTKEQRDWVGKAAECAPALSKRARQYDEEASFAEDDFKDMREAGLLTLAVPREYGGPAGPESNAALVPWLVTREIAKGSSSTAWSLLIHYHNCGNVARLGSAEQRERVLTQVVDRGAIMGSLGSEVNPQQYKAAADTPTVLTYESEFKPVEGGFLANGSKHFCSNAPVADYSIFWAIAPGATSRGEGIIQALVPSGTEGVSFDSSGWDEVIGLRSTVSWSATLEDVFIPWENVIGEPGDYVQKDPYTLELSQAAHLLGSAEAAFEFIQETLRARPFLKEDDAVMHEAGILGSILQGAEHSVYHTAWLWEQGRFSEAALASLRVLHLAKDAAMRITTVGFEIVGTRGLLRFHPLERAWRDIRTASLHTRETVLLKLIAQGSLDENYFPKIKYGEKVENPRTWKDLGLK